MRNLIFLIFEPQRNFRNNFDSVDVQHNSETAFLYQVKAQSNFRNRNFTIQCKYCIFCNFRQKRINNLLKKAGIYQNYARNEMKSSSVYRTALLIEKELKAQQILKTLVRRTISAMFWNKKLKRNATSAIVEVAKVALLIAVCPPLINCHCAVNVTDARQEAKINLSLAQSLRNFRKGRLCNISWRIRNVMYNEWTLCPYTGSHSALCKKFWKSFVSLSSVTKFWNAGYQWYKVKWIKSIFTDEEYE